MSKSEIQDQIKQKAFWGSRQKKAVYLNDVLKVLEGCVCVPQQKMTELLKSIPPQSCTNHASLLLYYKEAQVWFEKFGELTEQREK